MIDVEAELGEAVKHFWLTRLQQKDKQGAEDGRKDAGNRGAVTGGKHADGFVKLIAAIVHDTGIPEVVIHTTKKRARMLPGFFRPTKEWDLVVKSGDDLIAVVEVKSQVGSFGNNFNNRVEEALGNATDFWTAYRNGILQPSQRPWLGYLFMLEEHPASLRPSKPTNLDHYSLDEEFQCLSYAQRYQVVCKRLVRELLYDSACFFTSNLNDGVQGVYSQPDPELSFRNFAISLHARAAAFVRLSDKL